MKVLLDDGKIEIPFATGAVTFIEYERGVGATTLLLEIASQCTHLFVKKQREIATLAKRAMGRDLGAVIIDNPDPFYPEDISFLFHNSRFRGMSVIITVSNWVSWLEATSDVWRTESESLPPVYYATLKGIPSSGVTLTMHGKVNTPKEAVQSYSFVIKEGPGGKPVFRKPTPSVFKTRFEMMREDDE